MLRCFFRHTCDRGFPHKYHRVYERIFEPIRLQPLAILEVGVFKGAGIESWLDYFPNALVCGTDTFQRISPDDVPILKHERVTWRQGDSTTIKIDGQFDLIFDDGDHRPAAQRLTFNNLFPSLKPGGKYFIEDVWPLDMMTAQEIEKEDWLQKSEYAMKNYQALIDTISAHSVKRHDLRRGGAPDSYVLEIC